MTTKIDAKLKRVLDTHLPIEEASSRSVQRVAALWLGHTNGKIAPDDLRKLCTDLDLFDYQGRTGECNFGANFTQNMKKDAALFDGDHTNGWKLTAAGRAEAKSIFDEGNPPTRRRTPEGGAKPPKVKTAKKAATKKAPAAKKPSTKKAPATKKGGTKKTAAAGIPAPAAAASDGDDASKKAAKKRLREKKRDLGGAAAAASLPPPPALEPAAAPG